MRVGFGDRHSPEDTMMRAGIRKCPGPEPMPSLASVPNRKHREPKAGACKSLPQLALTGVTRPCRIPSQGTPGPSSLGARELCDRRTQA